MADHRRRLTVVDRAMIEVRRRDGWSIRAIARELGRFPGYLAEAATKQAAAGRRLSRRKPRLAGDGPFFAEIARLLDFG